MPATIERTDVRIERTFDAPREKVFHAWSTAESMARWYAPAGCTLEIVKYEFRKGGEILTCIHAPGPHDCWCKGTFSEVIAPERLTFSMLNCDEQGNGIDPASIGMDPAWPRESIVTVTFAEKNGKTLLTLHQTVDEALAKKTGAYPSWLSMLDNLANQLSR